MVVKQLLTAEEYFALDDDPGTRYELVRGELVEVGFASAVHGLIVGLIYKVLDGFVQQHGLGLVFGDGVGYIVLRDPDVVRGPDVSFVAAGRVPVSGVPKGPWPIAPDLAVEVVSPSERSGKRRDRIRDYLAGGSRLVWVAWPDHRRVTAHVDDGTIREYGPDDELDGGVVLPGFRVRVADLFPGD